MGIAEKRLSPELGQPSLLDQHSSLDIALHVVLIDASDMQTVWFPVPVAALFRRIVNVVSGLSISHHYLHLSDSDTPRPGTYSLRWPAWLARSQELSSLESSRRCRASSLDMYAEVSENTEIKNPPRNPQSSNSRDSWPTDQIHQIINNPALYDPVRKPRYPIVLCHGECAVTEPGRGIDANAG